jgi:hypothetical protein
MNQLLNTVFYRMYLLQPNYFLNQHMVKNNNRFYTEKFKKNNISGTFNYHKLIYDTNNNEEGQNNAYTIISNIAINDMENKITYKEYYEFKKFSSSYTELHELGKYFKTNKYLCSYEPLIYYDLPPHIKNFICLKTDEDIIYK